MANLLEETIDILAENGLTLDDIEWIGKDDGYFSKDLFIKLADNSYDDGYCEASVDYLFVVGKDWWLERHEYDSSEWWEFKKLPVKPEKEIFPKAIIEIYDCLGEDEKWLKEEIERIENAKI